MKVLIITTYVLHANKDLSSVSLNVSQVVHPTASTVPARTPVPNVPLDTLSSHNLQAQSVLHASPVAELASTDNLPAASLVETAFTSTMVPVSLVHQTAKAVLLWYALLV